MNTDRQIRFLYPPILVLAYFLWRFLEDERGRSAICNLYRFAKQEDFVSGGITLALAAGTLVVVLGYLLGSITYFVMRLLAVVFGHRTHEATFNRTDRELIWQAVMPASVKYRREDAWLASVWVDASLAGRDIHEWTARRWNGFNLAANICMGIVLTFVAFAVFAGNWSVTKTWVAVGVIAEVGFGTIAVLAWKDTMGMIRFSAERLSAADGVATPPKNATGAQPVMPP